MGDLKLKLRRGLLSGLLLCGGPALGQDSVLAVEAAGRSADARDAYALIEEGDTAYLEGDFETAVTRYSSAIAKLPEGAKAVAGVRAMAVQRFAQTALVRAQNLMRRGDQKAAGALLDQVEVVDPGHPKVKEFRAKMNDPIRHNPALTPEHAANVDRVRRLLFEAEGFYDAGQFDRAYLTYEDVLRIDQFNQAARRGMERVNAAKSNYALVARDQARAKALSDVAAEWENKVVPLPEVPEMVGFGEVPGEFERDLQSKLDTITVPSLRLAGASLEEAIDFLRVVSVQQDKQTLDEAEKGVPFIIQLGDRSHPAVQKIREARITLTLDGIPLRVALEQITDAVGASYRVDDFAVVLNARGFDDPTMIRRKFRVPPDFLSSGTVDPGEADNDPFADNAGGGGGLVARRITAEDRLKSFDVNFPEGASASYNKATSTLTVFNTVNNIRLVEAIVDELAKTEPLIVKVHTTFVDISQRNLEDLGFDVMAGEAMVGSNGILSGGTTGNGTSINDMVDGNPVTSGNRSGQLIPSTDGLDALLNRQPTPPASAVFNSGPGGNTADIRLPPTSAGTETRASGALSVRRIIDDTIFEIMMRAISRKKGQDVMANPEVVTRPGQNATVESVIEFPYPDDFEPPQLPNAVAGGGGIVTPATPTDFKTKKLGVMLEVLPQVGPNREIIEVALKPEVTDFEGYINYGTPIAGSTNNTTINLTDGTVNQSSVFGELTPNAILKPLFRSTRANTSVRIVDGQTIVMGGLVQEIRRHINDKVPILGDIPMVGRIFRQKALSVEQRSILIFVKVELTDPAGNLYRDR